MSIIFESTTFEILDLRTVSISCMLYALHTMIIIIITFIGLCLAPQVSLYGMKLSKNKNEIQVGMQFDGRR